MLGRSVGLFAVCTLLIVGACGDDDAAAPAPVADAMAPDSAADSAPRSDSGTPEGGSSNPPPASGAYRWYADIAPAHSLTSAFAVAKDGRVAIAFSPIKAGTAAGKPFTHFGPGTSSPNYDLLVVVIDPSGEPQWVKTFSTGEIEFSSGIAFDESGDDESGDVYVSGGFKDNTDGLDFGSGVTVPIGQGELSDFIVRLRGNDGTPVWATPIMSSASYVKPSCSSVGRELSVRGGRGAIGCTFDSGNDNTRKLRVGTTEIAGAAPNTNSAVIGFDTSNGQVTSSYVYADTLRRGSLRIGPNGNIISAGTIGDSCVVLGVHESSQAFRREFTRSGTGCSINGLDVLSDRVLIGGFASAELDLGDGKSVDAGAGFGFFGALSPSDGTNLPQPFVRYPGEAVSGVAADPWGQPFVSLFTAPDTFRYEKRGAAGAVIFQSKSYKNGPDGGAVNFGTLGIAADGEGALTFAGFFKGALQFDDGIVRGFDAEYHVFAARFAP